jgi:hypothetical protein
MIEREREGGEAPASASTSESSASGLLLWRVVRAVTQVREDVCDVCKLLLEVALEGLQALDQLWTAREGAAEEHPRATAPAMGMTVMHVHLLSS